MWAEHLIYSAALAVIAGMIFSRYTGRDPSWIIIILAFVPDIDLIPRILSYLFRKSFPLTIHHGDFHNLLFLIVFSLVFAEVLSLFGIRFIDGFICSAIGITAHFFEDVLVFQPAYAFLWPLTTQVFGIGIMTEDPNFFGIANNTILFIGIILLAGAILVRTIVEGKNWLNNYLP